MNKILFVIITICLLVPLGSAVAADYVNWTVNVSAYYQYMTWYLPAQDDQYARVTTNGWDNRVQIDYYDGYCAFLNFTLRKPNPFPQGQGDPEPTWTSYVSEGEYLWWLNPDDGYITTNLDYSTHTHRFNSDLFE